MYWSPIHFYIFSLHTCIKKYLVCDLNSVEDPDVREYLKKDFTNKKRRGQQHEQEATPSFTSFGQYFNNLARSRSNLPKN